MFLLYTKSYREQKTEKYVENYVKNMNVLLQKAFFIDETSQMAEKAINRSQVCKKLEQWLEAVTKKTQ